MDRARTVLREVKGAQGSVSKPTKAETIIPAAACGLIPTVMRSPILLPHSNVAPDFPEAGSISAPGANAPAVSATLDSGKLDCAIHGAGEESEAFIECRCLMTHDAGYEDHPWANRDRVPMSDLAVRDAGRWPLSARSRRWGSVLKRGG